MLSLIHICPADRLLIFADADADYRSAGAEQPPLRLSSRLSTSLLGQASDGQRSMLRTEYRLLSALYAQAEQQLAVAEQLSHLEAVLADLQRGTGTPSPPASPNLSPRATPCLLYTSTTAFCLFRFFDISKPQPARYFDEQVKNGFGVMTDDLVAAGYTVLVLAILRFVLA